MKNKKVFILYEYNQYSDDFNYIAEYFNLEELKQKNNIQLKNKKSIYHYIKNGIDEKMELLKNKYIIIKEVLNND